MTLATVSNILGHINDKLNLRAPWIVNYHTFQPTVPDDVKNNLQINGTYSAKDMTKSGIFSIYIIGKIDLRVFIPTSTITFNIFI